MWRVIIGKTGAHSCQECAQIVISPQVEKSLVADKVTVTHAYIPVDRPVLHTRPGSLDKIARASWGRRFILELLYNGGFFQEIGQLISILVGGGTVTGAVAHPGSVLKNQLQLPPQSCRAINL
jgi:hypothetical protein